MFGITRSTERPAALREQIRRLEEDRDRLTDRNAELILECDKLDAQHQRRLDDIRHTLKMREEAMDLEYKSKEMDLKAEHADELAKVKDAYRDKLEEQLGKENEKLQAMYTEVLQRLPKVSVRQVDGQTHHTERVG